MPSCCHALITPPMCLTTPGCCDVAAGALSHRRCRFAVGRWCGLMEGQAPVVPRPVPRGDKACPDGCNGVGVCNYDIGKCDCPAGKSAAVTQVMLPRTSSTVRNGSMDVLSFSAITTFQLRLSNHLLNRFSVHWQHTICNILVSMPSCRVAAHGGMLVVMQAGRGMTAGHLSSAHAPTGILIRASPTSLGPWWV